MNVLKKKGEKIGNWLFGSVGKKIEKTGKDNQDFHSNYIHIEHFFYIIIIITINESKQIYKYLVNIKRTLYPFLY